MSKGTTVYPVRIPNDLMVYVTSTIHRRNVWTTGEEWTLSDFIRVALMEKCLKMERSRRRRASPITHEECVDLAEIVRWEQLPAGDLAVDDPRSLG